jgi:hypothetical protein
VVAAFSLTTSVSPPPLLVPFPVPDSKALLPCPTTLTPDSLACVLDSDTEGRVPWSESVADACGSTTPDGVRKASELLPLEVGAAAGLNTIKEEYDLFISFVSTSNG